MNRCSYKCCSKKSNEAMQVTALSSVLQLVAEESRLKLLCILGNGSHCVTEMMSHVSLSQSLISHHLKDMKDAGMVSDDHRGLRVYYSLTDKGKHITNVLFQIPKEVSI